MKLLRWLLRIQGIYILITAIWPLVHIESFMLVTGPKHDIWLVKTVGALLIPVAICLLMYLFIRSDVRPVIALGSLTCISFMGIDFYYATQDVISDVYQVDGIIQLVFLLGWLYVAVRHKNNSSPDASV
jgi:hypothetical protein